MYNHLKQIKDRQSYGLKLEKCKELKVQSHSTHYRCRTHSLAQSDLFLLRDNCQRLFWLVMEGGFCLGPHDLA